MNTQRNQHVTSTPMRPVANVRVEMSGRGAGAVGVQNVTNRHEVKADALNAINVVLTGTQPELESMFCARYLRKKRMDAARTRRMALRAAAKIIAEAEAANSFSDQS